VSTLVRRGALSVVALLLSATFGYALRGWTTPGRNTSHGARSEANALFRWCTFAESETRPLLMNVMGQPTQVGSFPTQSSQLLSSLQMTPLFPLHQGQSWAEWTRSGTYLYVTFSHARANSAQAWTAGGSIGAVC
jgi:hypothetical protein